MLSLLCLTLIVKLSASSDLFTALEDLGEDFTFYIQQVECLFLTEELEIGQPYRLENGLEITSVKKPKKCVKKVRSGTGTEQFHVNKISPGFSR